MRRGLKARHGRVADQATQQAVRQVSGLVVRDALQSIEPVSARVRADFVEPRLYVGRFASGKTGEYERRIRDRVARQILGGGSIRVFGSRKTA